MEQQYIWPRRLLEYLCEIERRLPPMRTDPYFVSDHYNELDRQRLNEEAARMLEYVGMGHVAPLCSFEELDENTGGYISDARSLMPVITIKVSKRFSNNTAACRAILAHEICHRVLFKNNIDFEDKDKLEVFTDLCTIYVGFGRLILDGYQTPVGQLGYLQSPIYRHACYIMNLAGMAYGITDDSYVDDDVILQDAAKVWTSQHDKESLVRSLFDADAEALSVFNRNLIVFRQIIDKVYVGNSDRYRRESMLREMSGLYGKDAKATRLSMFRAVYEMQNIDKSKAIPEELHSAIARAMVAMIDCSSGIDTESLTYDIIRCPGCGKESRSDSVAGKKSTVRCTRCGIYFRVDGTAVNFGAIRAIKDREDRRRRQLEQQVSESVANAKVEQNRVYAMREHYTREGEKAVTERYSEAYSKLPSWLRRVLRHYGMNEDI